MKKFTKINYILTFILVFCIGATLPILIGSSHVDEQHSAKSEVPYCVTSPTVPEQVTFDGETIDLRHHLPVHPLAAVVTAEVDRLSVKSHLLGNGWTGR